jgi:Pro-kumamolisin, activation domain/Fibronectin type III domain
MKKSPLAAAPLVDMGRNTPTLFTRRTLSWRKIGPTVLGVTFLSFASGRASAESSATVELSPAITESTLLSAMDPAKEITIQLSLPLSDGQGAYELLQHISDPKDPLFRQYITVEEFAARFGGNAADFAAVKQWAVNNQLSILHESSARTSLTVRGTVAQMARLFMTQLNNYRSAAGDEFYSASVAPTLPSEIASKVRGVVGLTGGVQKAPLYKVGKVIGENPETAAAPTNAGTGPGGGFAPDDLKTAYSIPTFGSLVPQEIAIFEQGGIVKSDITTYEKQFKLPDVKITQVGVDGSDTGANGTIIEVDLDIDAILGLNPSVKQIQVYVADYQSINFSIGLVDTFDEVAKKRTAQTLSVSYGTDEAVQGATAIKNESDALLECETAGITVVVSAGDDGAYGRTGTNTYPAKLNAPDPGSQPLVTCVGGTSLTTSSTQQYVGEVVWNDLSSGHGATGGGVSSIWALPNYQPSSLVTSNGGSSTNRNVPDVGAVADPFTGYAVYNKSNGGWITVGGTSLSAPVWASYLSILNAGLQYLDGVTTPRLGFFNALLYSALGNNYAPAGSLYQILDGSNGDAAAYGTAGYNAGLNYNNCTGLGSLWGPAGYEAILYSGTGKGKPHAPSKINVKPASTSAEISWPKVTGATGYAVFVINTASGSQSSALFHLTKALKLNVTGLTAGQTYSVAVAAVNKGGAAETTSSFATQ